MHANNNCYFVSKKKLVLGAFSERFKYNMIWYDYELDFIIKIYRANTYLIKSMVFKGKRSASKIII